MLPPDFLENLKQRSDIVNVIGKRVKLQKKGREYGACCPFHSEKTPSFTVSPQKSFYYCFGCGAKGDALSFIIEHDRLPFMEAVKMLASETGISVPAPSPEQQYMQEKRQSLYDVTENVCRWYQSWLNNSPALQYLQQRGLTKETILRFRLGYAPDAWEPIKQQMANQHQQLLDSGMLIKKDNGSTYDRFRNRLMFPIINTQDKIIGFGGRVLSNDDQPKYLNSPETTLFNKSRTLYGLATLPPRSETAVVVEGYMDVIALQQFGIPALAPLGTALTVEQLQLLWQRFDCPILCFDGDNAGVRAAARSLERIFPHLKTGKSIRFVSLPMGEDPDSLIRKQGQKFFIGLLKNALSLIDFLMLVHCNPMPINPEGKADALKSMLNSIESIEDELLKNQFRQQVKNSFYQASRNQPHAASRMQHGSRRQKLSRENSIIGLLATIIHYPSLIDEAAEEIASITIQSSELRRCRDLVLEVMIENPDARNLLPYLQQHDIDTNIFQDDALYRRYLFARPNQPIEKVKSSWFEALHNYQQTGNRAIFAQGMADDE